MVAYISIFTLHDLIAIFIDIKNHSYCSQQIAQAYHPTSLPGYFPRKARDRAVTRRSRVTY
jgi:hypothetical protein